MSGVSDDVFAHYADYYDGAGRWRQLGAVGKAANIRTLSEGIECFRPTVLELGCGDGAVAAELTSHNFATHITGLDISPSGIEAAKSRKLARTSFRTFDGNRVPFADKSFDLVLLSHVVEHLEHPRTLLREAHRAGRYLVVEVPLELTLRTRRNHQPNDVGHINLYNPTSIRHLIQSVGIDVLGEKITNPSLALNTFRRPGWKGKVVWLTREAAHRVAPRFATNLMTYHLTLIGR